MPQSFFIAIFLAIARIFKVKFYTFITGLWSCNNAKRHFIIFDDDNVIGFFLCNHTVSSHVDS